MREFIPESRSNSITPLWRMLIGLCFLPFLGIAQTDTILIKEGVLKVIILDGEHWIHESYLELSDGTAVACNGLVALSDNEAVIMDTPVDPIASLLLLDWLISEKQLEVRGLIINHFHIDCLGGLSIFKERKIPSYASARTVERARAEHQLAIDYSFSDSLVIPFGKNRIVNRFLGAAHTSDNIVSLIPETNYVFGGCMIKSLGANYGNLADANVKEWPETIRKLKGSLPGNWTIVPGHGEHGDKALLDYTIQLFESYLKQSKP